MASHTFCTSYAASSKTLVLSSQLTRWMARQERHMGLALTVMLKLGLISSVRYKTCGPMRGSCDLLRHGCREKLRLLQHRYSRLRKFRSSMAAACPSSSSLTLTNRKFSAHAQFDFSDWYISSWWLNLEQYFLVYHGGMISNYLQNQLYMNSTSLEKYGLQLQIWPITLYVELFR